MGQSCNCTAYDANTKTISKLELLRNNNEKEKHTLRVRLISGKEKYDKYKEKCVISNESDKSKIKQLTNEKRHFSKSLKNERKNALILENTIDKYKSEVNEMEQTIDTLKQKQKLIHSEEISKINNSNTPITRRHTEVATPRSQNKSTNSRHKRSGSNTLKLTPNNSNNKPIFERIADSFPIPTFTGLSLSNKHSEPLPFKIKNKKKKTDSANESKTTDNIYKLSEENIEIEMKDTIELDVKYNAVEDAKQIYLWLSEQKEDVNDGPLSFFQFEASDNIKQLKVNLANLLTCRSQGHIQKIIESYYILYKNKLEKDIQNIIKKGHALEILHGLLMTKAVYDAVLIKEYVVDWDIQPVADIICCRNMFQLKELCCAYKKKCKLNLKKQLMALATQNKKHTLRKVIEGILDLNRKEDINVDMNDVNVDLNFVLTENNFKNENKIRLIQIFTSNSVEYIKILNAQFKLKSKDSLIEFIDNKLGTGSTAGYFCKTRILYALNTPIYYAEKIKNLGKQYKNNRKKIADIFIQRIEIDLELIQRVWKMKKYSDGQNLTDWIKEKTDGKKSGYFLIQMLHNCKRYTEFRKNDCNAKPKNKFEQMMMGN